MKTYAGLVFICAVVILLAGMAGCGGNVGIHDSTPSGINCGGCGATSGGATSGSGSTSTAPVTLTLLDPPTCMSPRGTLQHVYLTVTGIALNPDKAATAASSGWVDIAPTLASTPKQVDMFNLGTTLGNLATTTGAQGSYQSLRLKLAPNTATISNNQCGTGSVNCAMPVSGTPVPIAVSSESTEGIVLNSDRIRGGLIMINVATNINVLFDSCASLVNSGSGFRLLPSVYAWDGLVATYNVTLVDSVTQAHLGSGNAIVALEQPDASGADKVIAEGTPDGSGAVTLYGPTDNFDIVAVAQGTSGGTSTMYSPLVSTGIAGTTGSPVNLTMPLVSQGVASPGLVTMAATSVTAGVDLRWSVQQSATINGVQSKLYTIPFLDQRSAMLTSQTTSASGSTAASSDTAQVPSQPLYVQSLGIGTPVISTAPIAYTVTADAFHSQGAGVKTCTFPELSTAATSTGTISPIPGGTATATTLAFAGCQ